MSEGSEIGIVERAFQLARTGACHSVGDIRERLLREGYWNALSHNSGKSIKKQPRRAGGSWCDRNRGQRKDNEDA